MADDKSDAPDEKDVEATDADGVDENGDGGAPKRSWKSLLIRSALGLVCLSLGMGTSYFLFKPLPPEPESVASEEGEPPPPEIIDPMAPLNESDLQLADRLLTSGSTAQSLTIYRRLATAEASPTLNERLLYRIAVAEELLGDVEAAIEQYRQLVSFGKDPRLVLASKIGQSRIWLADHQPAVAVSLLTDAQLYPPFAEEEEGQLMESATFMLAFAYDDLVVDSTSAESLNQHARDCVVKRMTWTINERLFLPDAQVTPLQPSPDKIDELYRFGDGPEQIQLDIRLSSFSLFDCIQAIAKTTRLSLEWTPAAKSIATLHRRRINLQNTSLAAFLDMALASQGLSWTQRDGKITVQTEASLPPDTRRAVAVTRSDRFVRSAVARHPNSQWAPYAYLMMGVDSTREGDWIAADAKFRQILRQFPNTPLTVETNYNLGLTQLALRKPKEALSYFYDVVDMAPGHPLQAPAYLRAGKTELESGNVEGALRPLIRAASIASEPLPQAQAAASLATAYLMANNHHAGNTVLMEYRSVLKHPKTRKAAEVISALVQLRSTPESESKALSDGRTAVMALSNVASDAFFDACGILLVGEGLERVGLLDSAAQLYNESLQQYQTTWIQMQLRKRLAEHYLRVGADSEASPLLEQIGNSTDAAMSIWARTQLAALALRREDWIGCEVRCRELLKQDLDNDASALVLRILAKSFEARSEFYQAALCYSGMIPNEKAKESRKLPSTMPIAATEDVK